MRRIGAQVFVPRDFDTRKIHKALLDNPIDGAHLEKWEVMETPPGYRRGLGEDLTVNVVVSVDTDMVLSERIRIMDTLQDLLDKAVERRAAVGQELPL